VTRYCSRNGKSICYSGFWNLGACRAKSSLSNTGMMLEKWKVNVGSLWTTRTTGSRRGG